MDSDSSIDNPYRPPETNLVPAASVPMEFSGEIAFADYKRMLSTKLDIFLGQVLLSLGVLVLLPWLAATALMTFRNPGAGLVVLVATLLVTLAIAGAIYLVSPSARAHRYLRSNADLLGPAQGMLYERGLFFYDGTCKHWFSWASLHWVTARADGLRISLSTDPNRFLALHSRMFLPYNRMHAEQIIAKFGHIKRTSDELLIDSCDVFDKSVTDTEFFCGTISIPRSFRSAELWTSVISEFTTGIVLTFFAAFAAGYWRLVGILGIYCLVVSAQRYWLYLYGSQVTNHLAWGWIDSSGLIYAVDSQATWRPRTVFKKIVSRDKYAEFHLDRGECLFVFFEHMKNPAEFLSMADSWRLDQLQL